MQKTSFSIELIIGEDCSTDKTSEIIRSYAKKYPEIIKAFYNKENAGLAENFSQLLNKCKGKYIAICEGDDYWTDPNKLQKQVDLLEAEPDYIMCSHNSGKLNESTGNTDYTFKHDENFRYDQKRFIEEWVTQPLTCAFKNIFRDYTIFNKEYDSFCDVILFYELLKHGDGYFMHDNMATFRIHQTALSSGLSKSQWFLNHVTMYDYLYNHNKRDKLLQKISRNYCLSIYVNNLKNGRNEKNDFKPLREYFRRTPGIFEKVNTLFFKVPYHILKHLIYLRIKSIFIYDQ